MNPKTIIIICVCTWALILLMTPFVKKQARETVADTTLSAEERKIAERISKRWWMILLGSFAILSATGCLFCLT